MKSCPAQFQIEAFHDGELDPSAREEMTDHLAHCGHCAAKLGRLRRLSGLFVELKGRVAQQVMAPSGLSAIHDAVDASVPPLRIDAGFIRAAGVLMTLAASVVIISAVWLVELPSSRSRTPAVNGDSPVALSEPQPWERVAMGEPLPGPGMQSYETDLAVDWHLDALQH